MARTVKLELTANVSGLQAGLRVAQRAVNDSAREFDSWAKKHEDSLETVSKGMATFGVAAAGGAALAVKKFADFDKAMSSVQAATHETEQNMGIMRQAAIDAGADTAFSAEEAARGIEELAKAGVSTSDIIGGGLTGALDLAAAGELGVGKAAEIASSAMTQFKLGGDQVVHLADLLAAGAGKAQGGVEDLGMALNQSGLVAASTGLSIEETVGGLTAFASAGLMGSDAGTSFKTMLQRLTPQSKAAQKQFDELGISAYDANGEFIGLSEFAGVLQENMRDLTPEARNAAMSVMFGSDAVRASTILYEQGAEGIQSWISQVNDAGYAAETAAIMQDNLAGDLEKLGGAFDTVFIQAGGSANDALRGLVQTAESVVDAVGRIPAPILGIGTVLTGVAGGAALLGAGVINVLPKIRDTREALNDLAPAGSRADKALRGVAKAAGIATVAIGGLKILGEILSNDHTESAESLAQGLIRVNEASDLGAGSDLKGDWQGLFKAFAEGEGTLNDTTKAIDGLNEAFSTWSTLGGDDRSGGVRGISDAIAEIANPSLGDRINENLNFMNGWFNLPDDKITLLKNRFADLGVELGGMASGGNIEGASTAFRMLADEFDRYGISAQDALDFMPAYRDALQGIANQAEVAVGPHELLQWALTGVAPAAVEAASGAEELGGALGEIGGEAEIVVQKLDDILASLFALGRNTRSVSAAEDALTSSLSSLNEALGKNGKKFEGNSKAAMDNREKLRGVAADMESLVEAQARGGESASVMSKTMMDTYNALMKSTGGADELVRSLLSIPPNVDVKTFMDEQARQIAENTAAAIEAIPGYKVVDIGVTENGTAGSVQARIDEVTGKTEYIFVTDDGSSQTVQAGIAKIDGKDVPVYVTDDGTVVTTQGRINGVKGKDVTIVADAETSQAERELNNTARPRSSLITQTVARTIKESLVRQPTKVENLFVPRKELGGRAPGLAGGGRVPETGLGTDMVMGVNVLGLPHVRVDDREWVINRKSSDKHDDLLGMINRDDPRVDMMKQLVGLAGGGRVGAAEKRVKDLQRAYSRISGDKANRARKLAAKDQLDAAKAELKAAKASAKSSAEAAKEAKERANRLSESRRDLRVDLRRGTITDAFTGGSGLSQVDKLLETSRNSDYSMSNRKRAARDAAGLEKALASLTKRSEGLEKALEAAKDKADELRAVRDAVAGDLRGEFSLSGMLSDTRKDLGSNPFTAGSIASRANKVAKRIEVFAGRLNRLRKLGYGETIIQEIAALGTEDGILAAGALMNATKKERTNIIGAYNRLDRASGRAGQYVTESMYKGGLDAADGLVRGLESKSKHVENAFYKLGKSAEKSFKRSLGIKSPSRVMMQAGVHVGEGAELGILSKVGDVSKAAERLLTPSALAVPPSPEVARYAQAQAAAPAISTEAIAAAVQAGMAGWQPIVQIDGRKFYGTMQQVSQQYGKRR